MKSILNYILLIGLLLVISCKDDDIKGSGGSITADDFVYNKAIDYSSLEDGGIVNVKSAGGVRLVYVYLVRNFVADSLIYRGFASEGEERDYTFTIPYKSFPLKSLGSIKGVKVMAKQKNNDTLEGFIDLLIYDPAGPVLNNFPEQVTPDATGVEQNSINGVITSEAGLKEINIYDNYKGEWALLHSVSSLNEAKEYSLNYSYTYRRAASQIKIEAIDIFSQSKSITINLDVDAALFLPVLTGFPSTVEPDVTGEATPITGTITSLTGLKQIDIYDDYQGTYVLIESITDLSGVAEYDFNYNYIYRKKATHLKIEATDIEDASAHTVVELYVYTAYNTYANLTMMAQGTTSQASTTSFFVGQDGTLIGNCDISGNEAIADFLLYCSSSFQLSFYSPTNTASVGANYRCDGVSWVPDVNNLKATRFRVLVPGSATVDNIYDQYNADTIEELNDEFFTGISVPASSAVRYDASVAPAANIYNLTAAYLIWVRIPKGDGTFTNGLIRAKAVNIASTAGLSTATFDILLQK